MKFKNKSLSEYIDALLAKGQYTFSAEQAIKELGTTRSAFRFTSLRLAKKKKIRRVAVGLYVMIPLEYRALGVPPPAWFIDSLMSFHRQPYYVGILSAASLHGAAHQQAQVFQVVTNKPSRPLHLGPVTIHFFTKKSIDPEDFQQMKTPTGYMNVAIPETTALDLISYLKSAGYFNNVVTVLSELQDVLDPIRFQAVLERKKPSAASIQKLGYLLELSGASSALLEVLRKWIEKNAQRTVPLRTDKAHAGAKKNTKWGVYMNEEVESDL